METGSNKSLFTLIAVVIFGVFLSISYWMFQDEMLNVLASVFDSTSEMISEKLETDGYLYTDESFFTIDSTGTLTKYTGSKDINIVVIPPTINGIHVKKIGLAVFDADSSTSYLETVILPDTVIEIDGRAFDGQHITTIEFGNSLQKIGYSSFNDVRLTSLTLPDSLTYISPGAFGGTDSIKHIKLSENLEYIGSYAFHRNIITQLTIPDSVTYIGPEAFSSTTIKDLNLPELCVYYTNSFPSITITGGLLK